jgi:hypothetical protein
MSLLIPKPFDLGYGHAADGDLRQCIPNFFELGWLNYRDDEFHGSSGRRLTESGRLSLDPKFAEMQTAVTQP